MAKTSSNAGIVGSDVYLRYDRGPVQQFRVWDAKLFITKQVDNGISAKDKNNVPCPYVVSVATIEEYLKEKRRGR